MQITESRSGNRIEMRRSQYDKAAGRCKAQYVGSFETPWRWLEAVDKWPDSIGEVYEKLTVDERQELYCWLQAEAEHQEENIMRAEVNNAAAELESLAGAIDSVGVKESDAEAIFEAMAAVSKALRARGYTRSQFKAALQIKTDPNQAAFFEDSGHDRPWLEVKEEDE